MSENKKDFYDESTGNIEKLKSKYAGYGVSDDGIKNINKNILRSNPDYNAFEADFAGGFKKEETQKIQAKPKTTAVSSPAPKQKTATVQKPNTVKKPATAQKAVVTQKPATASKPISTQKSASVPKPTSAQKSTSAPKPTSTQKSVTTQNKSRQIDPKNSVPSKATMPSYAELTNFQLEKDKKATKTNKGKKKKSAKLRVILFIVFFIVIIWAAIFGIDIVRTHAFQDPICCITVDEYKNGSKDFMGLFYKIQFHVDAEGNQSYLVMPWFVQGPNANLERKSNNPKYVAGQDSATDVTEADATTTYADTTPVEITVAAEFIEEDTSSGVELTDDQKNHGYLSATLNKDGSITYQIATSALPGEVERLRADVEAKLTGITTDTDYPSIKKVEFSNDFSTVTLYADKAVYTTGLDSFISVSIYEWVGYYQSFAQKDFNCDLVVKDFADNSIIEQSKG